jgi:broad specificity phosphatase PhoE
VPIILLECLRESYLGEWQGRTKTELGFHLVENPDDLMPKDGESYDSMRKRASEFIHSLLPKHLKDTVLIV